MITRLRSTNVPDSERRRSKSTYRWKSGHRRQGLATLETVLSFPILIAMAAMVLAIGNASVRKCDAVIHARHAAWSQRDQRGTLEFSVTAIDKGLLNGSGTASLKLPPGLSSSSSGGTVSSTTHNKLLGGPWDDRNAGFEGVNPRYTPHLVPLRKMATVDLPDGFGLMGDLFSGLSAGAVAELDDAMSALSDFDSQVDKVKSNLEKWTKKADDLTKQAESSSEDSGGFSLNPGKIVTDVVGKGGKAAGDLLSSAGEAMGGDLGDLFKKAGGLVSDAAEIPEVIRKAVAAIQKLTERATQLSSIFSDVMRGGPGMTSISDESIQELQSSYEDILDIFNKFSKIF